MKKKKTNPIPTLAVLALITIFCFPGIVKGTRNTEPSVPEETFPVETESSQPTETTTPPETTAPTLPPETEDSIPPRTLPTLPPETTPPTTAPTQPQLFFPTFAPDGYFDDALFIGDSRTVGLKEYGNLPRARYFAITGMSVYNIYTSEVNGSTLRQLLSSREFGKIYIMLGINELGYDQDYTVQEYEKLVNWIRDWQPDAIVYIEANLHVSARRSSSDPIFNNSNIDAFNSRIAVLADGEQVFYLDVNPLFDDEHGDLDQSYTGDNTHLYGKYYRPWTDWIEQNAAVYL